MKPAILLLVLLTPLAASAQTFPADSAYLPLSCDDAPMSDAFADEAGALDARDIVGDTARPAGLRAADATHLFLRMRLEEDPAPGGAASPFSWGVELDTDGDRSDYEILILASGTGTGTVSVFRNMTTTVPNDPNDPADQPAVAMYTFANNARSTAAAGTSYGGSPDAFLTFAVPWSDLIPLGFDRDTTTSVWVATSSTANSLDGDVACHDPGTDGAPTLTETASDPTTGDPNVDPGPVGGSRLEGGGGCVAGGSAPLVLAALWLPMLGRRRRRHLRR